MAINRRDLLKSTALALGFGGLAGGQETVPVGKTTADQARNAELLSGYAYEKYATALTGYTGQDLQRIAFLHYQPAVRTRVGPRGNYKAGFTRLPNGKLVIAVCRDNNDSDRTKRKFFIGRPVKSMGRTFGSSRAASPSSSPSRRTRSSLITPTHM